ncbi:PREDICTED: uncharacterized protein LOC108974311 [Bactrocera latifrons]|uniref:uncharacterized protein LOC108974311 n=1 Tax=Bactrocera latifrons TaxID=174628 RepID=UPI0008DE2B8D|nr:PREDICTED: uncharacterized protein LOC108974311 [Bactrocera latifrons]
MSRQRSQTSIEFRKLVIKRSNDGKSVRELAETIGRSRSTVHDIIKLFKTNKQVENKLKAARNKICTDADNRYLLRKVKDNPFLNAPKLAVVAENELGKKSSASTIRNLHH